MGGLGESGTGQALAMEIRIRLSRGKSIKIIISGAGAQTGDLFFHSKKPLGAGSSENASILSVQDLGNHLWKVTLKGRIWNAQQIINLSIK